MELTANKSGSVSVKGNNSTLIIDPREGDSGEDVVLFMDASSPLVEENFGNSIVISGPGDYEIGGFTVRGEAEDGDRYFVIECGGEKILLMNASSIESLSLGSRFGTVLVRVNESFDEGGLSTLPGELILLYGIEGDVKIPTVEKMDKIGKRKKSELSGQTILLAK